MPPRATPTISLAHLVAQQCVGVASKGSRTRAHAKPFLGISDIAQLTYCEIQSTISQLATQEGYVAAARADDRDGGVEVSKDEALTASESARLRERLDETIESGRLDWDTRRLIGQLAETLELSGVPSDRCHFDLGDFFLIGRPDGLTPEAAIEFGASRYPRLFVRGKRVQGNLYALLWQRPRFRILVIGVDSEERIDEDNVSDAKAGAQWIERAWSLLSGSSIPTPPDNPRKCSHCRFNRPGGCPYPEQKRIPDLARMTNIAATEEDYE